MLSGNHIFVLTVAETFQKRCERFDRRVSEFASGSQVSKIAPSVDVKELKDGAISRPRSETVCILRFFLTTVSTTCKERTTQFGLIKRCSQNDISRPFACK